MVQDTKKNVVMPTFGYPSGVSKSPSYARFDVRDEACRRVSGFKHGQVISDGEHEFAVVGIKPDPKTGEARLWLQPQDLDRRGAFPVQPDDLSRYTKVLKQGSYSIAKKVELQEASPEEFDAAEDSDGEDVLLCYHCRLPVGTKLYGDKEGNPMHGECLAQLTLKDCKECEVEARKKEKAEKQERRNKYAIGWRAEAIPQNVEPAASLGFEVDPSDMCGLMLQPGAEGGRTAQVVPTTNPAANVNLEYLSLALKVRCVEGRELMFSLDPVADEEASKKDRMQEKVFTPAWLNGTSAGEVLFQADYHLKELSMGEYEQPVVGMKSCNDYSWQEEDWRAREWFVVKKAQIQKTKDDVLIPHLKMGVEAREQVLGADGLDDKPLSRPDHPLAKYAQDFTNNFDLIAERKSVVFHLRELAKASVLAKFMVETQVQFDECWLDLAGKASPAACMEIPQLWNERRSAQIQVQNGQIVDSSDVPTCKARGVYGGVSFGLSKFALSGSIAARPSARVVPSAAVRAVPSISLSDLRTASALVASLQAAAPPPPEAAAAPGAPGAAPGAPAPGMPSGMPGMMMRPGAPIVAPSVAMPTAKFPSGLSSRLKMTAGAIGQLGLGVGAAGKPSPLDPAGVDLNLDGFSLDEPVPVASEASGSGAGIAGAFWSNLEGSSEAVFNAEDKKLLKSIFNPNLSDRREEGDSFIPPDFNREYMLELHSLVAQEDAARQKRVENFLSKDFNPSEPGALFPYSWAATHDISVPAQNLQLCSDFTEDMFDLKATTPEFEKATEDGLMFRIYKLGSLTVRTTQEFEGKEVIGAVFSLRSSQASMVGKSAQGQEKIAQVSEYVEADAAHYRSYIVLETEQGNSIVTEKFADGTVAWEENPEALENRNALAKFIRSWDSSKSKLINVTVADLEAFKSKCEGIETGTSHSARKQYAQGAFNCARGVSDRVDSGFAGKYGWRKSEKAQMAKKETKRNQRLAERGIKA